MDRICVGIGRKELIQKPHLMAQAGRNVLKEPLANGGNFNSSQFINIFYKKTEPTPQGVAWLCAAPPQSSEQISNFDSLTKSTRACDNSNLKRLMRFLNGVDIILVDNIKVNSIGSFSDFSKKLISHTYAPLLELPLIITTVIYLQPLPAS